MYNRALCLHLQLEVSYCILQQAGSAYIIRYYTGNAAVLLYTHQLRCFNLRPTPLLMHVLPSAAFGLSSLLAVARRLLCSWPAICHRHMYARSASCPHA